MKGHSSSACRIQQTNDLLPPLSMFYHHIPIRNTISKLLLLDKLVDHKYSVSATHSRVIYVDFALMVSGLGNLSIIKLEFIFKFNLRV